MGRNFLLEAVARYPIELALAVLLALSIPASFMVPGAGAIVSQIRVFLFEELSEIFYVLIPIAVILLPAIAFGINTAIRMVSSFFGPRKKPSAFQVSVANLLKTFTDTLRARVTGFFIALAFLLLLVNLLGALKLEISENILLPLQLISILAVLVLTDLNTRFLPIARLKHKYEKAYNEYKQLNRLSLDLFASRMSVNLGSESFLPGQMVRGEAVLEMAVPAGALAFELFLVVKDPKRKRETISNKCVADLDAPKMYSGRTTRPFSFALPDEKELKTLERRFYPKRKNLRFFVKAEITVPIWELPHPLTLEDTKELQIAPSK